jgi:hypothetical protein
MIALLAYPGLIERTLTLSTQSRGWSACYAALIGLVGACAAIVRNRNASPAGAPTAAVADAEHLTIVRRMRWVVLAFVPSSMLQVGRVFAFARSHCPATVGSRLA